MKVKDLIKELKKKNPEATVYIESDEEYEKLRKKDIWSGNNKDVVFCKK